MNVIFQEWISFVFNTLIYSTVSVLTVKIRKRTTFFVVMLTTIPCISICLRFAMGIPSYVYGPITAVCIYLLLYAFSDSSKWLTTLFFLLHFLLMVFSEYISAAMVFLTMRFDEPYTYELVTQHPMLFRTAYYVIYIVGTAGFIVLWRKAFNPEPVQDMFFFYSILPMLLSQLGSLWIMIELLESKQIHPDAWYAMALCAGLLFAAAQVATIVLLWLQKEKIQKQDQKDALLRAMETQFDQLQQMMLQEKSRAKFRHDLNNQIQTVSTLYANGNHEAAMAYLQKVLRTTEAQSQRTFCLNPTINALLSQKMDVCQAENFRLDADISLPPTFTMDEMVLCSVFGNILDNAIQACRMCREDFPKILLTVNYQAGFLLIRCENSAPEPSAYDNDRNHWGLEIISDIADQYEGCLQTRKEGGCFVLTLGLQTQ